MTWPESGTTSEPDHTIGSCLWDERVYHPDTNRIIRPVAMLWDRPPQFMKRIFGMLHAVDAEPYKSTLSRGPQTAHLELEDVQGAAI